MWVVLFVVTQFSSSMALKITTNKDQGDYAIGTGILINPSQVLTAAHVILIDKKHDLISSDIRINCNGQEILAHVLDLDINRDIAVLNLENRCGSPVLKFSDKNPSYGQKVFAIGCPNGYCGFITGGIVSGYLIKRGHKVIVTDLTIWFGNSGGPLLNESGELIGMATSLMNFTKDFKKKPADIAVVTFSLFVPVSDLKSFLNRKIYCE